MQYLLFFIWCICAIYYSFDLFSVTATISWYAGMMSEIGCESCLIVIARNAQAKAPDAKSNADGWKTKSFWKDDLMDVMKQLSMHIFSAVLQDKMTEGIWTLCSIAERPPV